MHHVWHSAMEHTCCVVIELERVDEERLLKYLWERVYCYNWILKEDEGSSKVWVCVWWRKDYKQFSTTPLRSFLKRLKNKTMFGPKISERVRTEEGVQRVCKGVCGSISKYYLEEPLYTHLRGLLSVEYPEIGKSDSDDPNAPIISPKLDISAKLDLLLKMTATIAEQVKRLSEVDENVPSPLITHTGESTPSSLFTEPKMEQSFPFEDPILPMIPSAPLMF